MFHVEEYVSEAAGLSCLMTRLSPGKKQKTRCLTAGVHAESRHISDRTSTVTFRDSGSHSSPVKLHQSYITDPFIRTKTVRHPLPRGWEGKKYHPTTVHPCNSYRAAPGRVKKNRRYALSLCTHLCFPLHRWCWPATPSASTTHLAAHPGTAATFEWQIQLRFLLDCRSRGGKALHCLLSKVENWLLFS